MTSAATRRLLLVPLLVAAALVAPGCTKREPPPEVIRPVQLAPVVVGAMAATAVFAGEVKPRHETDLAFRIGGKIVERRVDVGAAVKKGQVLARLDPADVSLQAQAAEAAVAAARTESDFARAELERYQGLYRQKFVSESALDQKRNAMLSAGARLQQAQATLAVNRNQTAYATLVAPEDGVVTGVSAEAGQVVASAQTVMKLARTDEREVAISVPENRIGELEAAQRINVALLATPSRVFTGRVREVSPTVDPATRTFAVRVAVPDGDATLGWGMSANVVAVTAGKGQNALVPSTAIYHESDGRPAVWVYDSSARNVTLRVVELGPYREDGVVITRGLNDGEWIVAAGVNKLQAGQTVKPYEAPGKPAPPVPTVPAPAPANPKTP